jgi:hypothetical protein
LAPVMRRTLSMTRTGMDWPRRLIDDFDEIVELTDSVYLPSVDFALHFHALPT